MNRRQIIQNVLGCLGLGLLGGSRVGGQESSGCRHKYLTYHLGFASETDHPAPMMTYPSWVKFQDIPSEYRYRTRRITCAECGEFFGPWNAGVVSKEPSKFYTHIGGSEGDKWGRYGR
jgi:hypothetical protein